MNSVAKGLSMMSAKPRLGQTLWTCLKGGRKIGRGLARAHWDRTNTDAIINHNGLKVRTARERGSSVHSGVHWISPVVPRQNGFMSSHAVVDRIKVTHDHRPIARRDRR